MLSFLLFWVVGTLIFGGNWRWGLAWAFLMESAVHWFPELVRRRASPPRE